MLGDRLKWIRKDKGLTQQAFARPLSTSSGYISEVEQGKKSPGSEFLLSLMRVYRISVDWLLNGEGEPYLPNNGPESDQKLTRKPKDNKRDLDFNSEIKEIERLDYEAFIRVETYIKATIDTLTGVKKKSSNSSADRRKIDRRVKNDPNKAPDGQDRRSGKERRKAGVKG